MVHEHQNFDREFVLQRSVSPRSFWSLGLVAVAVLTGCLSTAQPNPPRHWHRQILETAAGLESNGPKLQVIVTYDDVYSTHAALRLAGAEGALFWDPAGRYGETGDGTYAARMRRVNDLIVANEPSLEMYWTASVNASDTTMEVFEWDLSQQQARRIRKTLLEGSTVNGGSKDFQTKTTKPFCSSAISEFLQMSEDDPVKLENSYLLPHDLARALYRTGPDRVLIFRRGRGATAYTNGSSKAETNRS